MTDETTTKRSRPSKLDEANKARREIIAVAILQSAMNNREVTNSYELVRYCFALADVFIEVSDAE
jgi:hypothetical protein